jgi:excisionase family DNA binding protein
MLLDGQALPVKLNEREVNMKNQIPDHIVNGVAAMLAPYCPGMTTERLLSAICFEPEKDEVETLLTRKEAAEALKVSIPTIDRCLRDGVLPKRRIRGAVRIPVSALVNLSSK